MSRSATSQGDLSRGANLRQTLNYAGIFAAKVNELDIAEGFTEDPDYDERKHALSLCSDVRSSGLRLLQYKKLADVVNVWNSADWQNMLALPIVKQGSVFAFIEHASICGIGHKPTNCIIYTALEFHLTTTSTLRVQNTEQPANAEILRQSGMEIVQKRCRNYIGRAKAMMETKKKQDHALYALLCSTDD